MKKKLLLLSVVSLFIFSCSTNVPTPTTSSIPVTGNKDLSKEYIESFDPPLKVGQKYTYIVTNSKDGSTDESSTEILDIQSSSIKVRFSSQKTGIVEKVGSLEEFSDDLPDTGILNEGNEDIKVPAGEYKGALKISYPGAYSNGTRSKVTVWLVKDIGAIKRIDLQPDFTEITTELKSYTLGG